MNKKNSNVNKLELKSPYQLITKKKHPKLALSCVARCFHVLRSLFDVSCYMYIYLKEIYVYWCRAQKQESQIE